VCISTTLISVNGVNLKERYINTCVAALSYECVCGLKEHRFHSLFYFNTVVSIIELAFWAQITECTCCEAGHLLTRVGVRGQSARERIWDKKKHTWCSSCFQSQSQAYISPADWQRSGVRLPAPWSDAQTATPAEREREREKKKVSKRSICLSHSQSSRTSLFGQRHVLNCCEMDALCGVRRGQIMPPRLPPFHAKRSVIRRRDKAKQMTFLGWWIFLFSFHMKALV